MRQLHDKKRVLATHIPFVSLLSAFLQRRFQSIKALPRVFVRAIHQPGTQYRLALVLAALLSFVLGWAFFISTCSHTAPLAFAGHLW